MQILSERLKELREEKQLSMYSLSEKIGVSDAAICKWENDISEPKASNIKNLAEFFEVSADFLLGLENEFGAKLSQTKKIPSYTQEEKKLIEDYRALSPALKEMIQLAIQTWKGAPANANKPRRA